MAGKAAEIVGFLLRCECGTESEIAVGQPFICTGCGTEFERTESLPPFTGKESFFFLKGPKKS